MNAHFVGWGIRQPIPPLSMRIDQAAFWHRFSTDRRDLLAAQEQARMDEVHASRASRRAEPMVSNDHTPDLFDDAPPPTASRKAKREWALRRAMRVEL